MPGTVVQLRRTLAAPREAVFRAWTDPEQLKGWFGTAGGGETLGAELDLRVGGEYRIAMAGLGSQLATRLPGPLDGVGYMVGTYLEIESPERLVFTMGWERVPLVHLEDSRVTIELRDRGASTTDLVLTHERLPNRRLRALHGYGWKSNLRSLERWLAEG
jgi:uncharacterized protein YndB with AHSA1/START domain